MKTKSLLVLSAAILAPALASAGLHKAVEVTLDLSDGGLYAQGNLSDAYNSADGNQLIGCGVRANAGGTAWGFCQAHDASDDAEGVVNFIMCTTSDPALLENMQSLGLDSFLAFRADPETGECLFVRTSHNSFYRPKHS